MSEEEQILLKIKGTISELSPAEQEACMELAQHFRASIKTAGVVGLLAMALVGVEMQLEASKV